MQSLLIILLLSAHAETLRPECSAEVVQVYFAETKYQNAVNPIEQDQIALQIENTYRCNLD